MRLLSIETSGPQWSVAIQDKDTICAASLYAQPQQAASFLIPSIQQLLQETCLDFQDLDGIAVARGPGSFTGIRVGLSTARGLSCALNCPLFALRSFEIVYHTLSMLRQRQEPFYVLLDTRGSLLCLCYFPPAPEKPHPPLYGTVAEIAAYLQGKKEKIVGDGLARLLPFGDKGSFLENTGDLTNRAVSLGRYILTHEPEPAWFDFSPLYGPDLTLKTAEIHKTNG